MQKYKLTKNMAATLTFVRGETPHTLLTLSVDNIKHGWATFHAYAHYELIGGQWQVAQDDAHGSRCTAWGGREYIPTSALSFQVWEPCARRAHAGYVPHDLAVSLRDEFNAWCKKHTAKWEKIWEESQLESLKFDVLQVRNVIESQQKCLDTRASQRAHLREHKKTLRRLQKELACLSK